MRSPQDWARAAAKRGYSALAVTDVNNLHGAVHFFKAAQAAGLKPIIGASLQWGQNAPLLLLVMSQTGYRNLCRILSLRHLDPHFTLATAACGQGFAGLLVCARSPALLHQCAAHVAPQNLYALPSAELPHKTPTLWDSVPAHIHTLAVPDAWFIDEPDRETFVFRRRLAQLADNDTIIDAPCGMLLPEQAHWRRRFPDQSLAEAVIERCNFAFEFGRPLLPALSDRHGEPSIARIRRLCEAAFPHKYTGKTEPQAQALLDKELSVIEKNGFADYFAYVHEIISFAHRQDIPVQVRGSAASSLVSYLLGFSRCCPIDHDLFFERFMNPGRRDYPDIDIDIADTRRDEVIRYCYNRWGHDHVAMIATILTYRTRSAIHDAGRLLRLPPRAVQRFLDENTGIEREQELLHVAGRLAGLPRHLGIHCGGLVITPCPLTHVTALTRASKGIIITHYEKDQAEAIGLVKMDLLGNSGLSVVSECCRYLQQRGIDFPDSGPLFDYKVNRIFASGNTLGVYQCESPGMRQLCRAVKPATAKEAAMALSLIRPGPAAAGMKDVFIERRRGKSPVTYLHPNMASFLDSTYGVMLYQEDVMKVAIHLAGYSIADADLLRRAVSKNRDRAIFENERSKFVFAKAANCGVDEQAATRIWDQVTRFASYSYCKAHASVYGKLAWLTARLKAHYPLEFYTAVLNCHKSMYPKRVFVWDAMRHGIPVLPPDINASELDWTPTRRGIQAGLNIIKGLRHSLCRTIVKQARTRPFASLYDLRQRVAFNAGELERLILVGACRSLGARDQLLCNSRTTTAHGEQLTLFNAVEPELPPQAKAELVLTDIPFSQHPVDGQFPQRCSAEAMGNHINRTVEMVGILDAYKFVQARSETGEGRPMCFVTLEDATGVFEVVLFPDQHDRYGHLFSTVGPYRLKGTVREQWDSLTLHLTEARRVG